MADQQISSATVGRNGSEFLRGGHSLRGGMGHDTGSKPGHSRNWNISHFDCHHGNSSTEASPPYRNHHLGSVPVNFRRENSVSSRLRPHQEKGRMPMPLEASPRVYSDRRISKNHYRWKRRRQEAQNESSHMDSELEGAECEVDYDGKPRAVQQFQLFSEDMGLLKEDIERCFPACLEPDAMDTSWESELNIPIRLRAIEMVATAVPINRMVQVYYEFLSMCYAEHNRVVEGWIEHAWGILSYQDLKWAFHERCKQEGVTTDLSSADQIESIFDLCLSEMVVGHNNAAVGIGGQQWTLDNLKRLAQQFLVPCHYGKDCPLREVPHRHRPLPF